MEVWKFVRKPISRDHVLVVGCWLLVVGCWLSVVGRFGTKSFRDTSRDLGVTSLRASVQRHSYDWRGGTIDEVQITTREFGVQIIYK